MARIRVSSVVLLCLGLALLNALSCPLLSQTARAWIPAATEPTSSEITSDTAAVQAIRTVMAKSGGEAAWTGIRSAEETFTVTKLNDKSSHLQSVLNDWSLDVTRYRRAAHGQALPPTDHSGGRTFTVKMGNVQHTVQEIDQARALVGNLPAAAAEIMLRRKEYVLKSSRQCDSGNVCVDVFREPTPNAPIVCEQEWTIAESTGLPIRVRVALPHVDGNSATHWEEVRYLDYAAKDGLIVPVAISYDMTPGWSEQWTFVSFEKNCGFDTGKFDMEIAR